MAAEPEPLAMEGMHAMLPLETLTQVVLASCPPAQLLLLHVARLSAVHPLWRRIVASSPAFMSGAARRDTILRSITRGFGMMRAPHDLHRPNLRMLSQRSPLWSINLSGKRIGAAGAAALAACLGAMASSKLLPYKELQLYTCLLTEHAMVPLVATLPRTQLQAILRGQSKQLVHKRAQRRKPSRHLVDARCRGDVVGAYQHPLAAHVGAPQTDHLDGRAKLSEVRAPVRGALVRREGKGTAVSAPPAAAHTP